MKIQVLEDKDNRMLVEISETNPVFVNTLRRTILTRVPVPAIEDVEVLTNTSAMYDEVLAHRLGLVPLKLKKSGALIPREECECEEGCTKCQAKFVLKKHGPATVYSKDLKPANPNVEVADKNIVILELLENQEVNLEMTAVMGTGEEHAKWMPAIVGYQYAPVFKVDKKKCKECKDKPCMKACPRGLITDKIELKDETKCDLCKECVEVCPYGAIQVEGDETRIFLRIESVSAMTPKEILLAGVERVLKDLEELEKKTKEALGETGKETKKKTKSKTTKKTATKKK